MSESKSMKIKEAINELKKLYPKKCHIVNGSYKGGFDDHKSNSGIAIDEAIKALEKQIPKRPIERFDGNEWLIECPSCKKYPFCMDEYEWSRKFCGCCGQAIKWK